MVHGGFSGCRAMTAVVSSCVWELCGLRSHIDLVDLIDIEEAKGRRLWLASWRAGGRWALTRVVMDDVSVRGTERTGVCMNRTSNAQVRGKKAIDDIDERVWKW